MLHNNSKLHRALADASRFYGPYVWEKGGNG